jgi:outer membrane protein OmpA-like peptidoglycan-associated protein
MKSATQIDLPGAVDFKTGSAKLDMTKNTTGFLTQVKTIMTSNPDINLLSVEGNTDNEGEDKGFDNTKLSQDRAQSVVDYLTKNGIDATRLKAVGNGSKNPLCANDSAEHKACNRRVEVHVRKFGGQDVQSDSSGGGGGAAPAGTSTAAAATSAAPAASGSAVGTPKPKTH